MGRPEVPLYEALTAFKRALVREVLAANGGNRSRAAAALKIERTSLLRLIRELGLSGLPRGPRGRPSGSRRAPGRRTPPAAEPDRAVGGKTVPEMSH